jgi:multidrug/hemolysin transport system permease protein
MVQDKSNGTIRDLTMSPVKPYVLSISYYISSLISTLLICFVAAAICLVYIAFIGWYMSALDVILLMLDIFILVMFGTALSSIINFFLSTQGQISAVGTIISSGYGFICGAYMPISQFSEGLQKVISFLPGTYGTALVRNHALRGVFAEMERQNLPSDLVGAMKDTIDCNLYFFDKEVSVSAMYVILSSTVVLLIGAYILMNTFKKKIGSK